MSDQASNNIPPGAPGGAPAPAPAGDNGGASAQPLPTSQRPAWAPEPYWDPQSGLKADEFGKHYQELAAFQKTRTEAEAALAARKPEDIKLELKLPDTVKLPEGQQVKIDDKDPRIPLLREIAIKHRLPNEAVNELVALDAITRLTEANTNAQLVKEAAEKYVLPPHVVERLSKPVSIQDRINWEIQDIENTAAETQKLGQNGPARLTAIKNWAEGSRWRGELSADEVQDIKSVLTSATTVGWIEKFMKRMNGGVAPNDAGNSQPKPAQADQATRWYGSSQQKAS